MGWRIQKATVKGEKLFERDCKDNGHRGVWKKKEIKGIRSVENEARESDRNKCKKSIKVSRPGGATQERGKKKPGVERVTRKFGMGGLWQSIKGKGWEKKRCYDNGRDETMFRNRKTGLKKANALKEKIGGKPAKLQGREEKESSAARIGKWEEKRHQMGNSMNRGKKNQLLGEVRHSEETKKGGKTRKEGLFAWSEEGKERPVGSRTTT